MIPGVEQCNRCGTTDPKAHVMDHIVTDYIAEGVVKHRVDGKLCLNCSADYDSEEFERVTDAATREYLRSSSKA